VTTLLFLYLDITYIVLSVNTSLHSRPKDNATGTMLGSLQIYIQ